MVVFTIRVSISKWVKTFQEASAAISVRVVGREACEQRRIAKKLQVAVEVALQTSLR